MAPKTKEVNIIYQPDIFIGLVGAVGTELDRLVNSISQAFATVGYSKSSIRLASLLRELRQYRNLPTRFVDEYIDEHMTAGDDLRKRSGRDDAVALLAVGKIIEERSKHPADSKGRVYILRSLKNPAEVRTLREIYGSSFYLIAAYSSLQERRGHLAQRIAKSRNQFPFDRHFVTADRLIQRDQEEIGATHGQNTRDSFHRADLFVDMSDRGGLGASLQRFVELLFGNTFHTPTKAEYSMFHAQAAALRSAELGRQVGAAISNESGDIIAVGCNEVPRAGGGLYWCGDKPDQREFHREVDSNEEQKRILISETLSLLQASGWMKKKKSSADVAELVRSALDRNNPVLPKDSKIRNLIEFGRAVHGEMAALVDAARRGVAVSGCAMFVTTFPCHLCARHIVAAGIQRVVYIEPYSKSLAAELYPDSIAVDGGSLSNHQIPFEPFVGIAPIQYMSLFKKGRRRDEDGNVIAFVPREATLRYHERREIYIENEIKAFKNLIDVLKIKGII